jgi:pimeloyl-ACP methyl ester carboxylesterase
MKRLLAAVAIAALAIAGPAAMTATAEGQPTRATKAAAAAYTPPPLHWGKCTDPDLEDNPFDILCADLVVPLDYNKPGGQKISLRVSRLEHSSPDSQYQGVMITNPGGPGASGLYLAVYGIGDFVPGNGDLTYDWIGFDPRGVGSSKPALTCNPKFFGPDRPNYVPTTASLQKFWLDKSKSYADDCAAAPQRKLLAHSTTMDTIRDLESLRKALGQTEINFYGFSYGTELEQVYATVHPNRVRRFVLDSNTDPRDTQYGSSAKQDVAFEKTIKTYFRWLAKYRQVFHVGQDADNVEAGYYRQLDKLDAKPIDGVGPDELTEVLFDPGYYVYDWVDVGFAYSDLLNHRDASGIRAMYDDTYPSGPGADNEYAMFLATTCTDDESWPRDTDQLVLDSWRLYPQARFATWANAWYTGACSYWHAPTGHLPDVDGSKVKGSVLLVDETNDPATPFAGSLEVRRRFPTASLIEGVGGTTHAGSLSGVACTDNAIGRYLTDGRVPPRLSGDRSDKECPPVPQPDPTAFKTLRKGSAGSDSAVLDKLRQVLARAQLH